jgi:hypothetical protein
MFGRAATIATIFVYENMVGQPIAFIARTQGADIGTVSVDDCILNDDDHLDVF